MGTWSFCLQMVMFQSAENICFEERYRKTLIKQEEMGAEMAPVMNGPTFGSSLQPAFWKVKAVPGAHYNYILLLLCSGLSKYESTMGHRLVHIVSFPVPSLLF